MATTQRLELKKDLVPLEENFISAEAEYGVNACFLASIAAVESDWGTSNLAKEKNNLFGWRLSNGEYMSFDSTDECIDHVAKYLAENYLDPEGCYYNGDTVADVAVNYCDGNEEWINLVEEIMETIDVNDE